MALLKVTSAWDEEPMFIAPECIVAIIKPNFSKGHPNGCTLILDTKLGAPNDTNRIDILEGALQVAGAVLLSRSPEAV